MIYYICKYTPVEIFEAMGKKTCNLSVPNSDFSLAHRYFHQNMCTYTKSILDWCLKNEHIEDEIILTNCCDSMKRLYDILNDKKIFKNIFFLNVPHSTNETSKEIFYKEILSFINSTFDYEKFKNILCQNNNIYENDICILGARCKDSILDILNNYNIKYENLTCTNNKRCFNIDESCSDIIKNYTDQLLSQFPCMHMINTEERLKYFTLINKNSKALIYNTVKFCDNYSFEYALIKNKVNIPVLKIEQDYSTSMDGQIKTRIEAFVEETGIGKSNTIKSKKNTLYSVGIDSGSTSTNVVILDKDFNIVSYSIVRTGAKICESAKKALDIALSKASLDMKSISSITATGYGRISIPFCNEVITEITCHAAGAFYLNNNVRTVIDIGGQDSKVIKVNADGNVLDFIMNDKCAAGTGRFLEMMSKTLDIPIDEMSIKGLKYREEINITSMCSVFAESEVISLIAKNKALEDIIHGINNSVAARIISMVHKLGGEKEFMITGGVAKNLGVIKALEEKLQVKILIPFEPEIVGALGAAILGMKNIS